jgi:hypothetical protein
MTGLAVVNSSIAHSAVINFRKALQWRWECGAIKVDESVKHQGSDINANTRDHVKQVFAEIHFLEVLCPDVHWYAPGQ